MQLPNQSKNKKSDPKSATKITEEERKRLYRKMADFNIVQNKIANICLEKELAIRQINTAFEQKWAKLMPEADSVTQKKKDAISDLSEKYGICEINPDTGDIIRTVTEN